MRLTSIHLLTVSHQWLWNYIRHCLNSYSCLITIGVFVAFLSQNNEIYLWHDDSQTLLAIENSKQFVENHIGQGNK